MVTHVEIYPYDGKLIFSDTDKTTVAIEPVYPYEKENICRIISALVSKIHGALGTAYIHLGSEYDNSFRKKMIDEASIFKEVKIIDEFSMKLLNVISQSSFLPAPGNIIWILHVICPGEEYCDIWKMEKYDVKFVKSFKCNWHNFTQENIKKIKEQSTLGNTDPSVIFCPLWNAGINGIPNCQIFSYSNKRQPGGIIYCYMNKFISILPVLDRNVSLKVDGVEKFVFSKMESLPLKKATITYGYDSFEVIEYTLLHGEKRKQHEDIPTETKSLIFEIDEHGIYSFKYESITLVTIWGKEIDVYDNDTKNIKTIGSDLQQLNRVPAEHLFYEEMCNQQFLQSLMDKVPEMHGCRSDGEMLIIRDYLSETMQTMFPSRDIQNSTNDFAETQSSSSQSRGKRRRTTTSSRAAKRPSKPSTGLKRGENPAFNFVYPNEYSEQQQHDKERLKLLLNEATKNYQNIDGIIILPFLPNTTERDHNEYAALLKKNKILNACCINMVEALVNGIYKKYGKPDIQHYIAAIYHHSYLVLAYFQNEDSKIEIKAKTYGRGSKSDTAETFIRWFVGLKFKRNSKIHLSTSNFSHQKKRLGKYKISVAEEKNLYELIIDGSKNLNIEFK